MRKLIAMLVVGLALLLVGCAHYPQQESDEFSCLEGVPFDEAVKILNTPKKIDNWIRRCIIETAPYNPSTPRSMYIERKGACKSCSIFVAHLLSKNGYDAIAIRVAYVGGSYGCHGVCVYRYEGKWWICGDTVRLFNLSVHGGPSGGPYNTINDAANAVALGTVGCPADGWSVWHDPLNLWHKYKDSGYAEVPLSQNITNKQIKLIDSILYDK